MTAQIYFTAIVCEFNPLHYGHRRILDIARSLGHPVLCVMSGNFVQRGEAAILDKWTRTRLALENGADLVIELPLSWAASGAERFAMGAVQLLNALNLNGYLLFGSESGDTAALSDLAAFLLTEEFSAALSEAMKTGVTFAHAREQAAASHFGSEYASVIRSPNNILAIEYIKAMQRTASRLKPKTVRRAGAGHDQNAGPDELPSARELRRFMQAGESIEHLVPASTFAAIESLTKAGRCPVSDGRLELAIMAKLRQMSVSDFSKLQDISEGLEYRLHAAAREACSLSDFYARVKSKRYTHARIRRLTLSAFLGLTKPLPASPPYLRILGMNAQGDALLHIVRATLPIVSRPGQLKQIGGDALTLFESEAAADDLYALAMPRPLPCGMDYKTPLIKIR